MSFDAATRTFSGTAPSSGASYTVGIVVTDPEGASTQVLFQVVVSDAGSASPVLAAPIPAQHAVVGTTWSYTLPAGTFTDADTPQLTYTAYQVVRVMEYDPDFGRTFYDEWQPLPEWIAFDPATGTFSATSATLQSVRIGVIASDGLHEASDVFALSVGYPQIAELANPGFEEGDTGWAMTGAGWSIEANGWAYATNGVRFTSWLWANASIELNGEGWMSNQEEEQIANLLKRAAKAGGVCRFAEIFDLFPDGTKPGHVFACLEAAASSIAEPEVAIYSAVMSKKDTGCPGDGFFDTFKLKHEAEYASIAGENTLTLDLTQDQMERITKIERQRVYLHAADDSNLRQTTNGAG